MNICSVNSYLKEVLSIMKPEREEGHDWSPALHLGKPHSSWEGPKAGAEMQLQPGWLVPIGQDGSGAGVFRCL